VKVAFKEIEIQGSATIVMHLKQPAIFLPWNFSCATGAEGMILPKKYFQQVGADGFGPGAIGSALPRRKECHRLHHPAEALDQHWRDGVPKFKTVTFMLVPEESTRMAQLRTGEADVIAVSARRCRGQSRRLPCVSKLNDQVIAVYMQQQWIRCPLRLHACGRPYLAIDQRRDHEVVFAVRGCQLLCIRLGSYGVRVEPMPPCSPYPYNPQRAKQLLGRGRLPHGFDTKIYSYVTATCLS